MILVRGIDISDEEEIAVAATLGATAGDPVSLIRQIMDARAAALA